MKYKLSAVLLIIIVMAASFTIKYNDQKETSVRVHQHQTAASIPTIDIDVAGNKIEGMPVYQVDEDNHIIWDKYNRDNASSTKGSLQYTDGNSVLSSEILIHIRGNSSRYFDKKSYVVHLTDKNGQKNFLSFDNMGDSDEWILNGPFLDRTLIRNYMCMNIAGEIMEYAPEVRFVRLNIDGEYQGLYLLMESITREESRLNLNKTQKGTPLTSYIVKLDRTRTDNTVVNTFSEYTLKNGALQYDLCYPGTTALTQAKMDYIQQDMSQIEKTIYSYDLFVNDDYLEDIDITAFAKYFVINEFFGNMDAGYYSTYLYKDVRGQIKPCVWDFNNACDNYMEQTNGISDFEMQYAQWFERLILSERFTDEVIYQYKMLRQTVLSDEYLQQYITDTTSFLGTEINDNYKVWNDVWDYSDKNWYEQSVNYLNPLERNVLSYDDAVTQLRTYIHDRGQWLDQHIDTLRQYSHPSRTVNERPQ